MLDRLRAATAIMVGIATVTATPTARGEEPNFVPAPRDPFGDAKRRGDDALVSGRPAEALAAYKEAYEARADPALVYNMARAHQALGDYPTALELLERFDATAPTDVRARVPGLPTLLADVRKRVATVAVSCDVAGATVRLDARVLGTTPLSRPVHVATPSKGPTTLSVDKSGFFPFTRVIVLQGGAIATFDVKLTSKDSAGIVTVRSPTDGALIAVDGKPEGTVPSELVLSPGSHRVELTQRGYRTSRMSIDVAAGEKKAIDVTLTEESPITKKWWFWTGAALVTAGVVVAIIAATTEREPDSGNIGNVKTGLSF